MCTGLLLVVLLLCLPAAEQKMGVWGERVRFEKEKKKGKEKNEGKNGRSEKR